MIAVVRSALALVDSWTRRRLVASALFSLVLAGLEMGAFALLFVLITLLGHSESAQAGMYPRIRDVLGVADAGDIVPPVAALSVALLLLKSAAAIALARWNAGVQSFSESRLATRLYRQYIRQDYLTHIGRNSSELVRNLTMSVSAVCTNVLGALTTVLSDGAVLAAVFLTLVVVDAWVAAAIAGYLLLVVAGYLQVISPVIHRVSVVDNLMYTEALTSMQEGFGGIKAVQVLDVAENFAQRYDRQRASLARARSTAFFVQRLPPYYLESALVIGISGGAVALLATRDRSSAFALLSILVVAALRVLPSVNRVLQSVNVIRGSAPAVENLLVEQRRPQQRSQSDESGGLDIPLLARELSFRDVCFTYPGVVAPAVREVNLAIPVGQAVGIVGPSGSGKTTLVDLCLGLFAPQTGAVLVDGSPLTPDNSGAWRRQVGYVPQETYLMDADVFDNVVFERVLPGDRAQAEVAVWDALERAQLASFVRGLPAGLGTSVGERGARFSGGQRQRLGIARALLLRPRVLILDEATSALDGTTEAAIAATIAELHGEVTLIVIAHRLSTVRSCERILMMDAGTVVDEGSFDELFRRNITFRRLVEHAELKAAQ